MIHFRCPCGKALHAREEYVGQTTRCPQCGTDLAIPSESGVQAAAPPPPRDWPDEPPRRGPGRRYDRALSDRPRPPATSGMAVASMVLGLASLACSLFTAIPAVILGALGLRAINRSEGRLQGKGLAVTGLVTGGLGLLLTLPLILLAVIPFVQFVREGQSKRDTGNNLVQIGMAMQSYQDANNTFPPAALCDARGNKLLSWRVAILPYIDQENLYRQFHLNEPWDSPHNLQLLPLMPKIYALPGDTTAQKGYTYYRVFVGNGAAFDEPRPGGAAADAAMPGPFGPADAGLPIGAGGPGPFAPGDVGAPPADPVLTPGVSIADFPDGVADTILVVEAAMAVPWTKPDELPYDPSGALPPLGGHYSGGFYVLMGDGSHRFLPKGVSQATLRAEITRNGGEIVDEEELEK